MKLQLIMLPNPIVVSDEKVTGVTAYNSESKQIEVFCSHPKYDEWGLKIIAGIQQLPSIDFSALSEEDCKKIGWVDVEKLARSYAKIHPTKDIDEEERYFNSNCKYYDAFKEGFKAAQSLNEKKFSEEDLIKAYLSNSPTDEKGVKSFIQSLSQPKVFDVEVEMKLLPQAYGHGEYSQPKITNNSIKILKIL